MLERHDRAITLCAFCPKLCRHACPVAHAEARETVTPQAKQALLDRVRRGLAPLDAEAVDVFHRCTGCGLHATACELGVEVAPVLFDARAEAVRAGVVHPALSGLEAGVAPPGPAGAQERDDAGGVLFFAGCVAEEDGLAQAGLDAARRALPGVRPAVGAGCCGYPLLAGGRAEAFARQAAAVRASLRAQAGPSGTVVTGDPICAWTLRKAWPEPLDVRHLAEVVPPDGVGPAPGLPAGRPAYHDPCHLGRKLGVAAAPRRLVAAATGAPPLELEWADAGGGCSGGGGLLPLTAPETAAAIAADLRRQAKDAGATYLITACPLCRRQLDGDPELPVVDLASLL